MGVEQLQKELESVLGEGRVLRDEPLARHTTFRAGGPADLYLMPDAAGLPIVMERIAAYGIPVTVIGNGSNLLVGDKGIRGAVIEIGSRMAKVSVDGEHVTAQAGALLSKTAYEAYRHGLSGMEFAAGIPGSVGGAVVMNAGAYGGEVKDIAAAVTVLTKDGRILKLPAGQMAFSYRHSCVPENGYLVLAVTFALQSADPAGILEQMEELKAKRISKQPLNYPSAGSTFKRPPGQFAGKLIMDAGLAGFSIGGAQVSPKHCGFVINRGGAAAADILDLIRHVQRTVQERFGVELETEVKLLGEF